MKPQTGDLEDYEAYNSKIIILFLECTAWGSKRQNSHDLGFYLDSDIWYIKKRKKTNTVAVLLYSSNKSLDFPDLIWIPGKMDIVSLSA